MLGTRRYAEIECDHCGLLMPRNEAHEVIARQEILRSNTEGISRTNHWFRATQYHRRVTLLLCHDCAVKEEAVRTSVAASFLAILEGKLTLLDLFTSMVRRAFQMAHRAPLKRLPPPRSARERKNS